MTLVRFLGWNILGILVYLAYGRARSLARKNQPVVGI